MSVLILANDESASSNGGFMFSYLQMQVLDFTVSI
jgi:hypothetical protein